MAGFDAHGQVSRTFPRPALTTMRQKTDSATKNPIAGEISTALLLLLPLILLYLYFTAVGADFATFEHVNAYAPFYFIAILLLTAYRVIRRVPDAIWTPALWFPLASAAFFGFGPLVEVYGNESTLAALRVSKLAITPEDLFRANLLCAVGVFAVLLGFWAHAKLNPKAWLAARSDANLRVAPTLKPETVALCFVVAGAFLTHGLINPSRWGMIDVVVPGFVAAVGRLTDAGFAVMAYLAARGNRRMLLLFLILWPVHLFLCILDFAKSTVVLAVLLPAIGAYAGHRKISRFGISIAATALIYVVVQPLVTHGRLEIHHATGSIKEAGYGRRIDIVRNYVLYESQGHSLATSDNQDWWTRLDYAGVQAFAMSLYDQGYTGETIKNVWIYFIPRVIWPDKPLLVTPGHELTGLILGNPELSNTGLSIYADAYWQFGWAGLVIACLVIGLLYGVMTVQSLRAIASRDFILLPTVLITIRLATLGTTEFLTSYIGVLPIYFAYLLGVRLLATALRSSRVHSQAATG